MYYTYTNMHTNMCIRYDDGIWGLYPVCRYYWHADRVSPSHTRFTLGVKFHRKCLRK